MSSIDVPPAANGELDAGHGEQPMPGELIYEYTPRVTRIVEYGASAEAVLMRTSPPPEEGARLDLYLEGPVVAGRLQGTVAGVDYLNVRADGRAELHIHGHITLEDGKRIALEARCGHPRGRVIHPPAPRARQPNQQRPSTGLGQRD